MKKPTVYLGGSITGLTFNDAWKWREYIAENLLPEIECKNPLKCESFLRDHEEPIYSLREDETFGTGQAILTKDRFFATQSDIGFFYFPPNTVRTSFFSCVEVGWFDFMRKPMIWCATDEFHAKEKQMLLKDMGMIFVKDLEESIEAIREILL